MTEKTEALRLAAELDAEIQRTVQLDMMHHNAAAELRRLHTDAEESEALRERLSALLRNTAIALRGPEPELTRWSWHDLPELATALKAELRRLLAENESLRQIVNDFPPVEAELREVSDRAHRLEAQRDALLEALKTLLYTADDGPSYDAALVSARAAIKKAEEA